MSASVDGLLLGYRYATPYPDPGPPPRRPTPPDAERLNPEWAAVQRQEERHLDRPLRVAFAVAAVIGLVLLVLGVAGELDAVVAGLGVTCCVLVAGLSGYAAWQGERAVRSRLAEEQARLSQARAAQESQLFASQEEHARQVRDWQARRDAYERQKRWYPVCLPDGVQRVDVAGGTPSGWSALLATAGAHRLAAGGEVTVIDLSEAPVGLDLLGFARASGIDPLVWVLPDDLPRLGPGPGPDTLAGVISLTGGDGGDDQASARDLAVDRAIADRVIDVLGAAATVASVAAGLRALARIGDPEDVASGLLSAGQADRLGGLVGADDRVVRERAWVLEARLRKLAAAGTDPADLRRAALRVVAIGQRAADGPLLGTYLAVTLTHALRGTPPGRPWQHAVFVFGADRLPGDVLDGLGDVCESTGTGLVLAFRAVPPQRWRGRAAIAVMRQPTAEAARAVGERLATGHRFVLSQLTETVGQSVGDTCAGSYTSAAGSPGATAGGPVGAALSTGTTWGAATAEAVSDGEPPAMRRSRELPADAGELQHLPPSAMIIGDHGGQAVLADANPGIGALSAATELTLEESRGGTPPEIPKAHDGQQAPVNRPRPNVGPPPPRLDWRRRRRRT
jgi:hypothetical protein